MIENVIRTKCDRKMHFFWADLKDNKPKIPVTQVTKQIRNLYGSVLTGTNNREILGVGYLSDNWGPIIPSNIITATHSTIAKQNWAKTRHLLTLLLDWFNIVSTFGFHWFWCMFANQRLTLNSSQRITTTS